MGFFKDVATAFKPSSIAKGLEQARNPMSPEQLEESLKYLTPEQRAKYDANMAQVEQGRQEARESYEAAKAITERNRVLDGPAGRYLHGSPIDLMGDPDEVEAKLQTDGVFGFHKELREKRKGEFKEGLRASFGIAEVKEVKDPAERQRIAAEQRAERDAARGPYRAANAAEVRISRLATRGDTQLTELLSHLTTSGLGAHPEKIFGVSRVPDRISPNVTPHSEKGRVVEWDIIHEPIDAAAQPPAAPLVATAFQAGEQWVARREGEPSIVDEELGLSYLLDAGIPPDQCLGLARVSEFRARRGTGDEDSAGTPETLVQGLVAVHPSDGGAAFARLRERAPLPLKPVSGVVVEVLNWEAVGKAVHLKVFHPPPVPSPFPYLPATPQELLRSYLEIVGLRAADTYSAQATVDTPQEVRQGGFFQTNIGPKQPCADGKERRRAHMCEYVVLVYRDRPEYAEGRARWDAYMRDVLQANLRNGVRLRQPVVPYDQTEGVESKTLRRIIRVSEAIDRFEMWGVEDLPPHRYCWPPVQ
ncbi:MAG: hypothetical protein JHC95_16970 [Solirubrobacteraceae bacterium]|nr:hypothetical protein [Solirubrobacteraceae bacterium]